ncbi:DUF1343 domain-containing protein [Spongiivirga sp. MCCC 1A20706]|uniref:exo-beta-N-acetylmuramidase NamZ family protein n=1 Tax=Spongiivirga sp. MCCC 1A20706 TaxID=3160963 RepID=UPI003977ADA7
MLQLFKNTLLACLFLLISCGSNGRNNTTSHPQATVQKKPTTAANQTEIYLNKLKGKHVGIVANQTSVIFKDNGYTHLIDSLLTLNIDITKVFAPEHGFRGAADAGEDVEDGIDKKTKLPIFSLHGKHKKPTKEQLEDLDLVVFDIQDVGVRFYTYISTLHYVMEACAEQNKKLLIFDRPNPNGHYVDGPTLEKEHSTFLGKHPIPLVHGMTIGEYAQMINGEGWLKNGLQCDIEIITVANYNHATPYSLVIRPSPNLPNDKAINLYPSLGLFEGTYINAGRGTEFQFQRYGAPFLDSTKYDFKYWPRPNFGSKYPKHSGGVCYGKDLTNSAYLSEVDLSWVIDAYNNTTDKSLFFKDRGFTIHAGNEQLRKQIETGMTSDEIRETWKEDINRFLQIRKKYLLYD